MKYFSIKRQPRRELRCNTCRSLIAKEDVPVGAIEIKCHRCGAINTIDFKITSKYMLQIILGNPELKAEVIKLLQEGGDDNGSK